MLSTLAVISEWNQEEGNAYMTSFVPSDTEILQLCGSKLFLFFSMMIL
jgi:hypothetical protein